MKTRFLWVLACITMMLSGIQHTYGQSSSDSTTLEVPKNIVKIQPFQFVDNTFFLGYEGFNADHTRSINFGLGFITSNAQAEEELGFKYEVQYRIYVNGLKKYVPRRSEAAYNRGIYASVYLSGVRSEETTEFSFFDPVEQVVMFRENKRTVNAFNPGVTIGIQRSVWDMLYIDFYVGGGVRFANVEDSDELFPESDFDIDDVYDREYTGVFPKIGLAIGIGF